MLNTLQRRVLVILIVIAVAIAFGSAWINTEDTGKYWFSGLLQNFSTELFGAFVTFALFDLILGAQKERETKAEAEALKQKTETKEKSSLITDMRSTDNAIALKAINQLRDNGWLSDGTLQGATLMNANLVNAPLFFANLANAHLMSANLQNANLQSVNLERAMLYNARLYGADLSNANLLEADFQNALFNSNTILPDGSKWTSETVISRYTDPNHPNSWTIYD